MALLTSDECILVDDSLDAGRGGLPQGHPHRPVGGLVYLTQERGQAGEVDVLGG